MESLRIKKYTNNSGDPSALLASNNKTEFLYFMQKYKLPYSISYSRYYKDWYFRIPQQQVRRITTLVENELKIWKKNMMVR